MVMQPGQVPILVEYRALTDEDVVGRVRAGETALFEIVMRRHNQRLFRVARAVLRDDAEAEDAVQQAYLSAYSHLDQFAGQARFSTWLTRITLNESLARRKKRIHLAEVEMGDTLTDTFEETSAAMSKSKSNPNPEDQASMRELTGLLEAAVDELPEIYRVVFMMREVQELSTAETAACLELTEEAVKVRLHRAKGFLRETLFARLDARAPETFSFLGARCDRIVANVLARLPPLPGSRS
jgi:RNA polymerase sigma-70 factor (ECF subfamily)